MGTCDDSYGCMVGVSCSERKNRTRTSSFYLLVLLKTASLSQTRKRLPDKNQTRVHQVHNTMLCSRATTGMIRPAESAPQPWNLKPTHLADIISQQVRGGTGGDASMCRSLLLRSTNFTWQHFLDGELYQQQQHRISFQSGPNIYECTIDQELSDAAAQALGMLRQHSPGGSTFLCDVMSEIRLGCISAYRTTLSNFIPIRFQTTEP